MAGSWSGSISFGLIYIPISLQVAAKEETISFNQLHNKTKQRIRYKKTCADCDNDVSAEEIVKGYEYEKGKYVIFEDSDFDKIKTEKDESIVIEQFVNLNEIDPIFYEKSYYVIPKGAEKAFELLKRAMNEENKVGIAKVVLREKETLIALRVNNNEMVLSKLFFFSEIQKSQAKEYDFEINEKELKLAKNIINSMTAPFKPEEYKDEYRQRVLKAIEAKIQGQEIVQPEDKITNKAIDLMEALQGSLEQAKNKEVGATH